MIETVIILLITLACLVIAVIGLTTENNEQSREIRKLQKDVEFLFDKLGVLNNCCGEMNEELDVVRQSLIDHLDKRRNKPVPPNPAHYREGKPRNPVLYRELGEPT